jgi:putative transposase
VLADELARTHPGAAASLREGMQETLTVTRLGGAAGSSARWPRPNPCESMIETVRRISPTSGALVQRRYLPALDRCRHARGSGTARRIIGYPDLAKLAVAVEHVAAKRAADTSTTTQLTVAATAPEVRHPA